MINILTYISENYTDLNSYIPIALIGTWRWIVWLFKKIVGAFYRPQKSEYQPSPKGEVLFADANKTSVSVITPVYNEDPLVFRKALDSWASEMPKEIIAIIDYTDQRCIDAFNDFAKSFKHSKIIITHKPGKREALADGIDIAKSEICALVDADTIWTPGVIKNSLIPFKDIRVGGVATRQNVVRNDSFARVIFDIQLDQRYDDEMAFLAKTGNALTCLSGRTAFYRSSAIKPLTHDLVNEYFMGRRVISGDDKRLTFLIQSKGWKTTYQSSALVLTPGSEDLASFFKQRIRWGRNSWRANLSAIKDGWIWQHRALSYFIMDQFIQPFTLTYGLFYFLFSVYFNHWLAVSIILTWWVMSRGFKAIQHFARRPMDIVYLPAYILVLYPLAVLKIFSLVTIDTQGWITKWDSSRLVKFTFLNKIYSYGLTTIIIAAVGSLSLLNFVAIRIRTKPTIISNNIVYDRSLKTQDIANKDVEIKNVPNIARYSVKKGDTLGLIARKYNLTSAELLKFNITALPNWNQLSQGQVLTVPLEKIPYTLVKPMNYQIKRVHPLILSYNAKTDTIALTGRGQVTTISQLAAKDKYQHIKQTEAGTWFLTSNLLVGSGVTLNIDGGDTKWLKLLSNKDKHISLQGYNSRINMQNTKITSWDDLSNDVDKNYTDKRAFILLKASGRMDIYNSEIAYLGYKVKNLSEGGTYGLSWRVPTGTFGKYIVTGEVIHNDIHDNYFGAYTYGATGIVFKENKFHNNVIYGLDPHDDSNHFLVENNQAYENGTHGIIFSKRCIDNIIRGNIAYNNGLHGIMLHEKSTTNLVENNTVYGNKDGIAIYNSNDNIIKNNTVYGNAEGVRLNREAANNTLFGNNVNNNTKYAFYLYDGAVNNFVYANQISSNPTAIYIRANSNEVAQNKLVANNIGIALTQKAENNKFIDNEINGPYSYSLYSKTEGSINIVGLKGAGTVSGNKTIAASR